MSLDLSAYFDPDQELPGEPCDGLPGYRICTDAEYRAFRGLNASTLKEDTAAEMWHAMTQPEADHYNTAAAAEKWTVGLLLHEAVLRPHRLTEEHFEEYFCVCATKGLNTVDAMNMRRANPGKIVINPEILATVASARDAMAAHPRIVKTFGGDGYREASCFWFDPDLGIWRKMRVDYVPRHGRFIADVKTTAKSLRFFQWTMRDFGYWEQSAWYLDTHHHATGIRPGQFVFAAVTKDEPFMARDVSVENDPGKVELLASARRRLLPSLGKVPNFTSQSDIFLAALTAHEQARREGRKPGRAEWPAYEDEPEDAPQRWLGQAA